MFSGQKIKFSFNLNSFFYVQIIFVVVKRLSKNEQENGPKIPKRWFLPTYFAVSNMPLMSIYGVHKLCSD